ncbi:unconventional myosin-Ic-like [Oppia nitens]|uniref:unconventional myosin-Ic-like n=1 Tax=Oppia nitens TaxID=1686743 RepID=UPI0023D9AE80|nr:unconventional myosin-Ic-like [Oppia nitens]XP_054157930.1 unconventional myosin-Ic-like [Oppia nitens]
MVLLTRMESELHARDRVGVEDFVLLEDYTDPNAFMDNLKKRSKENLIYTFIGQVLVSVNPYKNLDIYSNDMIETYRNVNLYELPPHIFAISDVSYRLMREECRDQCILISGESGSGKTEASKKILQFLAAASHHNPTVESVKDRLLLSNPVLEAFGNAKTNRNDNSSRFGKYMDIEFDYLGTPLGGHINNYLLEKSRVIHQNKGERNFHIFYQLINGADDETLGQLFLRRDPQSYYYLNQGDSDDIIGTDDAKQYSIVTNAFKAFDFKDNDEMNLLSIVASVLHLGNTGFYEENGEAVIAQLKTVSHICKLLKCKEDLLQEALTNRTIEARGESVSTPLTRDQAIYARDALAKAVYERLFTWLVNKLNESLESKGHRSRKTLMGLLDIYGFEIFTKNSFEQFCINYCNEKLQQLFIELTLKSEQEEYRREEIEWEPIEYFNNRIICDLIEERHKGIIALLDEECLRPGDASDDTFLEKLELNVGTHPHFCSHNTGDNKTKKIIERNQFRLSHYAGEVVYNISGFLDKNNDLLYRDLKRAMNSSGNPIIQKVFTQNEINSKKRPLTAGTQFKNSLSKLMDALLSKEPWYVRCIKPNDNKMPNQFDEQVVRHQVKYLGLIENLRVRRAGFAYRRTYDAFLHRYKSLCPQTWPHFNGTAKDGVRVLVNYLGYDLDQYRMGKTKLFIRFPRTLFDIEDAFQQKKHELVAIIQARVKGRQQRKRYLEMRQAVTVIASYWRRFLAIKLLARRRLAAHIIRTFIKGFITRNEPENDCNRAFVKNVRAEWLKRLSKQLPKSVLDKSWSNAPKCCLETSELLRKLHQRWLVRKYIKSISPERKRLMDEKVVAEELFRGKKISYPSSIRYMFKENRLSSELETLRRSIFETKHIRSDEKTIYCTQVVKFDRHGYKQRPRILLLTNSAIYLLNEKDMKPKHRLPYKSITEIVVSDLMDDLMIIKIPAELKQDKGDLILDCKQHIIEVVTKIIIMNKDNSKLNVVNTGSITHLSSDGKVGQISFSKGIENGIIKRKDGVLQVTSKSP